MAQQATILLVDDEPFNIDYLTQELEELDYDTIDAYDGIGALALAEEAAPDLILLDIMLPGLSGFDVLTRLKAEPQTRDIPVLVISALTDMASVVRGIELGAEDYLGKPFDPLLLKTRIRTCLDKKRLRDLEKRYLRQELALRQNEKLATIGRLSASLAHELNNPASAAQQSAHRLAQVLVRTDEAYLHLLAAPLTAEQHARLAALEQCVEERVRAPLHLGGLERSDRVEAVEEWLLAQGTAVEGAASTLVELGQTEESLPELVHDFARVQWPALLTWFCGRFTSHALLAEIHEGATRISTIVQALKLYSYLDQGPVQQVDVHQGLESTLLMLRSKLGSGIIVQRNYAPELPHIEAYGSELNQVWTNLIDNAIDAMGKQGTLTVNTRREGDGVAVEIIDSGSGIPAEVQPKIFDPFFTTKAPGQGSGLGLSISHQIVVQKHGGKLAVTSQPGHTCFALWLPLTIPSRSPAIQSFGESPARFQGAAP